MSVLMNVVSICRNRSGLAWASCSCRKRVGSILLGAVIALVSWSSVRGFPEDHAVAAFASGPHPGAGGRRTPLWRTRLEIGDLARFAAYEFDRENAGLRVHLPAPFTVVLLGGSGASRRLYCARQRL